MYSDLPFSQLEDHEAMQNDAKCIPLLRTSISSQALLLIISPLETVERHQLQCILNVHRHRLCDQLSVQFGLFLSQALIGGTTS